MKQWRARYLRRPVKLKVANEKLIMSYQDQDAGWEIKTRGIAKVKFNPERLNVSVSLSRYSRRSLYFEKRTHARAFFNALRTEIERERKPSEVEVVEVIYPTKE